VPNSKHHNRPGDASPSKPGQEMSGRCPFCAAPLGVTARPGALTFAHPWPMCGAWDRVCYVGGFSQAEREALETLIRGYEPGAPAIKGPFRA